jgi:hypothetical protein
MLFYPQNAVGLCRLKSSTRSFWEYESISRWPKRTQAWYCLIFMRWPRLFCQIIKLLHLNEFFRILKVALFWKWPAKQMTHAQKACKFQHFPNNYFEPCESVSLSRADFVWVGNLRNVLCCIQPLWLDERLFRVQRGSHLRVTVPYVSHSYEIRSVPIPFLFFLSLLFLYIPLELVKQLVLIN